MTLRQRIYLSILAGIQGLAIFAVPPFLLAAYLTRDWGILRVGECTYRVLYHIYCPGCGVTRSLTALLRFDFVTSFICSPTVLVTILLFLWADFWMIRSLIRRKEGHLMKIASPHLFWLVPFLLFGVCILRNVLLYTIGYDALGDFTPPTV